MYYGHWTTVLSVSFLTTLTVGVPFDSSVKNTMEIQVVVDKLAFNSWKKDFTPAADTDSKRISDTEAQMTTYINSVFIGVNAIFKELNSYGINLDARIVDIKFITNETISTHVYDKNKVNSDKVLATFEDWLAKKPYPTTDHTLLLTGYDLANGTKSHVLGVAYLGQMCDSTKSLSAVEVQPNGNTVLTLAHELGHSLNAKHDGAGNTCPVNSMKIMDSGRSQNSTQNFKFSSCSRHYIENFLHSLHNSTSGSCLSATNTNTAEVQGKHLGQLYDADTICRMSVGPHSYFGRTFYGVGRELNYSSICTAIWCLESGPDATGASTYTSVEGTDGFPCGSGKECSLGFCLTSQTASTTVYDTCPFGDAPSYAIVHNGKTCDQLVTSADTSSCYRSFAKRICCASCHDAQTGIPGCEYGDQASWCSTMKARSCYSESNRATCCTGKRCKQLETSIPGCKYGDKAHFCATLKVRECYANNVSCCQKCKEFETSIPGCEYGDRASWCANLTAKECYTYNVTCCQKCKEFETSIPECRYGDQDDTCPSYITENKDRCQISNNRKVCCKSCANYGTAGTNTGTGTSSSTASGTSAGTSSSGSGTASGTNAETASSGTGSGSGSETGTAAGNSAGTASSGSASAAGTNTGTASSGTGSGTGPGTASSGSGSGSGSVSGTGHGTASGSSTGTSSSGSGSETASGNSSGTSSAGSGAAIGSGTGSNAESSSTSTTSTAQPPVPQTTSCPDRIRQCSAVIWEAVPSNHHLCYDYSDFCCATCKRVEDKYRDNPGCKYGDIQPGCKIRHCSLLRNIPLCCQTCKGKTPQA